MVTALLVLPLRGYKMSAFLDENGKLVTVSSSNPLPVGGLVTVSSSNPLPVGGKSVQKSASFTRPADTTAYAANDAIADSTSEPTLLSFANCANAMDGGQGYIVKTRLLTNQKRVRHVLDYRFITQHQALLMITHLSPCFTQNKDKLIGEY